VGGGSGRAAAFHFSFDHIGGGAGHKRLTTHPGFEGCRALGGVSAFFSLPPSYPFLGLWLTTAEAVVHSWFIDLVISYHVVFELVYYSILNYKLFLRILESQNISSLTKFI
jgi:hypothetical protein